MKVICWKLCITILPLIFLAGVPLAPALAGVKGAYLYRLSDFTGAIPYSTPRVTVDKERKETYVLYQNSISVFNESGMEVYRFGDDLDLGQILDIALDGHGNPLILSYRSIDPEKGEIEIIRCNFRGEPTGKIVLKNLPAGFSDFQPNRISCSGGTLYLANLSRLKIVLTDSDGNFRKGYDLIPLLGLKESDRGDTEIGGFSLQDDGSILFTIPVRFSAHRLYPDGKLASFGKPGGAPGKFNVVSGIVADSKGNYLVVDKLKSTVMVFDQGFNYLNQFGYRGLKGGGLIAPDDIAIDKGDRVYVTQNGKRGVSVFGLTYN